MPFLANSWCKCKCKKFLEVAMNIDPQEKMITEGNPRRR